MCAYQVCLSVLMHCVFQWLVAIYNVFSELYSANADHTVFSYYMMQSFGGRNVCCEFSELQEIYILANMTIFMVCSHDAYCQM